MPIRSEPPYPVLSYEVATDRWTVVHEFIVYEDDAFVRVPGGYQTDLATIPRLLWTTFAAPYQLGVVAPIVHDFVYDHGGRLGEYGNRTYTRKETDRLFYRIMRARGVRAWRAGLAYVGVRLFGRGKF